MHDDARDLPQTTVVFHNWARTFSCKPAAFVAAKSEADVLATIAAARTAGRTIRVVGAGHSPSDIACTDSIMLSIDAMNRVMNVDLTNKIVTVQAGIRLSAINELLDRLGLALPNLGSISEQSVAGAIATGTHGTGIQFGILATCIVEMRLITSTSEILTLSKKSDPELFSAALCSLGCLGVVTQVAIQAVDAFDVCARQIAISFDEMVQNWDFHVRSADHVRFWWFPHTNDCVVWKGTRLTPANKPPQKQSESNVGEWIRNRLLRVHLFEMSLFLSTFVPSLVPAINQRYFDRFFRQPQTTTDKSHKVFNFDCLFSQYVTEWAVEWRQAPAALSKLKQILSERSDITAHLPIEIRFVRSDEIALSGAYGRDTCFIGIILYRPFGKNVSKTALWDAFEGVMNDMGGRPHWAKSHPLRPEQMRNRYPLFDAFCNIRKQIDPHNLFVNDYIKRHILDNLNAKL